ncbi:hypothetical protein PISMIDRAFT_673063 [Pisolithus microcarpus 441]|uniref:Uncharacterized protein n=1 Tax=Pisolithus microcarpus 441 TaxID=765257 RepID=A0A0D0A312_9AGAM|nr:hypothetical protein PISMIDRAFT_673063 [Pisolithus microcarpus 441]
MDFTSVSIRGIMGVLIIGNRWAVPPRGGTGQTMVSQRIELEMGSADATGTAVRNNTRGHYDRARRDPNA